MAEPGCRGRAPVPQGTERMSAVLGTRGLSGCHHILSLASMTNCNATQQDPGPRPLPASQAQVRGHRAGDGRGTEAPAYAAKARGHQGHLGRKYGGKDAFSGHGAAQRQNMCPAPRSRAQPCPALPSPAQPPSCVSASPRGPSPAPCVTFHVTSHGPNPKLNFGFY